jgi:hypothetical protein
MLFGAQISRNLRILGQRYRTPIFRHQIIYKGVNGLKTPKVLVTCNKVTADYDSVCGAARAESYPERSNPVNMEQSM